MGLRVARLLRLPRAFTALARFCRSRSFLSAVLARSLVAWSMDTRCWSGVLGWMSSVIRII